MTIHEASRLWNISERRIAELCKNGTVEGAEKIKNRWIIPDWTSSPRTGKASEAEPAYMEARPTGGISDYEDVIRSKSYYVDKTLLIKEIIDKNGGVYLITRPRRFGKSMNISMLQSFFELSGEDKTPLFIDKLIWKAGPRYTDLLGRFPVIKIDLKNVRGNDWEECMLQIRSLIQCEYNRHAELEDNEKLTGFERDFYSKVIHADENVNWAISLKILSDILHRVYERKCIILIDEYDTPIETAYARGYYDECMNFMRMFFSYMLKDNPSMELGYMTGILRVAKESIFSGLNNVKVYSLLDDDFSASFGYTYEEVTEMAAYYGKTARLKEIREWYDGYRFGNREIYNPWSVNSYFSAGCVTDSYWVHTSGNETICRLTEHSGDDIKRKFLSLTEGESIREIVDTGIVYPDMHNDPNAIFSFLLMTGYLKISRRIRRGRTGEFVELAIPNREIRNAFITDIMQSLDGRKEENHSAALRRAIDEEDIDSITGELRRFLKETVSFYDTSNESFYQGLMIGFYSLLADFYNIRSNRESGYGRFDIALAPAGSRRLPGIIMELKVAKTGDKLKERSIEALNQIDEREYRTDLKSTGITRILKIGLAFCGKDAETTYEIESV